MASFWSINSAFLEINKILNTFRKEYKKRYSEGNVDRLVELYHPDAVVVHVGQFAKHKHDGRTHLLFHLLFLAIKEVLKKWITEQPKVEFEVIAPSSFEFNHFRTYQFADLLPETATTYSALAYSL